MARDLNKQYSELVQKATMTAIPYIGRVKAATKEEMDLSILLVETMQFLGEVMLAMDDLDNRQKMILAKVDAGAKYDVATRREICDRLDDINKQLEKLGKKTSSKAE